MSYQNYLVFSEEVQQARQEKLPIVALESTFITHGLPQPLNYETALQMQDIIRANHAIPATIALMNGKIHIGLEQEKLQQLVDNPHAIKASKRDIAYALTKKLTAGTTVAATLLCAHLAGIKVFATGGIGGVHRGQEHIKDISADIPVLAQIPIALVCSGAKSILDIPNTLEYFETLGIPIIGYKTKKLPLFYSDESLFHLNQWADDINELASLINTQWQLNMESGILVANPVAKEFSVSNEFIEPIIEKAIIEAQKKNITGKAVTPFLLNKISELSDGKSLHANLALLKKNAELGAKLAIALM